MVPAVLPIDVDHYLHGDIPGGAIPSLRAAEMHLLRTQQELNVEMLRHLGTLRVAAANDAGLLCFSE